MTADGANPLQLTYGEFDATAPRWSPDGRRIAYVSNEGESGNTSLRVIDLPGGERHLVRADRRVYKAAGGPTAASGSGSGELSRLASR